MASDDRYGSDHALYARRGNLLGLHLWVCLSSRQRRFTDFHSRSYRYHPEDPDSAVSQDGALAGFEASILGSSGARARKLRVGFVDALVSTYLAQPDVAKNVAECTRRLRQLVIKEFGVDSVVDLPSPAVPVFGREWVTAVGAYR